MLSHKMALSLYLTYENVRLDDCFDEEKIKEYLAEKIELKRSVEGRFYIYKKDSPRPSWADFVQMGLTLGGETKLETFLDAERHSISGCVAIPIGARYAVITFGHGSSLINWRSVVNDFGKKIVLNTVDVNNYISVRSSHYDRYPRFVESQASRQANLYEFELDFELQMLTQVTGDLEKSLLESAQLEETDLGLRITGSNSLSFSTYRDIEELRELLIWFCGKYEEKNQNDFFDTINTLQRVEAKYLKNELDKELCNIILTSKNDSFYVIVPKLIDYEEYQTFRIEVNFRNNTSSSLDMSVPSLETLQNQINRTSLKENLTIDHLKKNAKLVCISSRDPLRNQEISVYHSLTGEILYNGAKYSLMGGRWYQIDINFYHRIIGELSLLTTTTSRLTKFNPATDKDPVTSYLSEGEYNARQAREIMGSILFDKEKIIFRGRGTVEACDLIVQDEFYHVKRYTSSSTLSHLFFQGSVSASAILEDENQYRKRFLEKVGPHDKSRIETLIQNKAFIVVYTILIEQTKYANPTKGIENLPGFSIISLYKTYKDLKRMGITMRLELLFY